MITIKKEKPAKEELKLFSVEIVLTPDVKDHMQMEAKIKGHRAEMMAFLEKMEVDPTRNTAKYQARATESGLPEKYEMSNYKRKQRIFYILSPDYLKTLKVLTANELAELLGIRREHLDIYLVTNPTFKGYPIAEE